MKPYNYVVHTNDAITKHMFSDMERYHWLTCGVATVGMYYGLAIELQAVPSKMANNFDNLNCRAVKFGISNVYGLLYTVTHQLVIFNFS